MRWYFNKRWYVCRKWLPALSLPGSDVHDCNVDIAIVYHLGNTYRVTHV